MFARVRKDAHGFDPAKPNRLLQSYIRPHKPITSESLSRWIKDILARAGTDTSIFKAHSVRGASDSPAYLFHQSILLLRESCLSHHTNYPASAGITQEYLFLLKTGTYLPYMVNDMMQSKTMWLNQTKKDASKIDKKMRKVIFSAMFHLEEKAFLEV